MAPILQSRPNQRIAILSEITSYEGITNGTVSLASLRPLLASVKSYIEGEVCEDDVEDIESVRQNLKNGSHEDDFGDIEDEDLMLAETVKIDITNSSTKRTIPSDFDDATLPKKHKMTDDPSAVELAESILQRTWGFPHFRFKQQQAISRLITGGSTVVIFPTGGGKSLVYQIPALAFDPHDEQCGHNPGGGVTLVVSPLIALMKVRGKPST